MVNGEHEDLSPTAQRILDDELDRAIAELHIALDLLHDERERRAQVEARVRAMEGSRTWRWSATARRTLDRLTGWRPPHQNGGESSTS